MSAQRAKSRMMRLLFGKYEADGKPKTYAIRAAVRNFQPIVDIAAVVIAGKRPDMINQASVFLERIIYCHFLLSLSESMLSNRTCEFIIYCPAEQPGRILERRNR